VSGVPRRNFLKLTTAAAVGLAISRYALAAEKAAPPKASNVLSPDAALKRLIDQRKFALRQRRDEEPTILSPSVPLFSWARIRLPAS
jgi:hypothetical protein